MSLNFGILSLHSRTMFWSSTTMKLSSQSNLAKIRGIFGFTWNITLNSSFMTNK